LNILPLSRHAASIRPIGNGESDSSEMQTLAKERKALTSLQDELRETQPVGTLVSMCKTLDQANAVMTFVDAISEKTLRTTSTLTAGRGRGKSAALVCLN